MTMRRSRSLSPTPSEKCRVSETLHDSLIFMVRGDTGVMQGQDAMPGRTAAADALVRHFARSLPLPTSIGRVRGPILTADFFGK